MSKPKFCIIITRWFLNTKKIQTRDDRQENSVIRRMSHQKNCKGSTQDLFFLYEAKGKFLTQMLANKSLKCNEHRSIFVDKRYVYKYIPAPWLWIEKCYASP